MIMHDLLLFVEHLVVAWMRIHIATHWRCLSSAIRPTRQVKHSHTRRKDVSLPKQSKRDNSEI